MMQRSQMDNKSQQAEIFSPSARTPGASRLNQNTIPGNTHGRGGMAEHTTNINAMMVSLLATQGEQSSKDASKVTN